MRKKIQITWYYMSDIVCKRKKLQEITMSYVTNCKI